MARILLAGDSSSTHQQLSSALSSQGWAVKSVESREQALVAAAEEAPNLVVVHQQLLGAEELVSRFSRQSGGPGVVLVAGQNDPELLLAGVEAVLRTPLETEELVRTVRDRLAAGGSSQPGAAVGAFSSPQTGKQLTSQDIFGDLLQEMIDTEAAAPGGAAEEAPSSPPAGAATAETVEAVLPVPPPSRPPVVTERPPPTTETPPAPATASAAPAAARDTPRPEPPTAPPPARETPRQGTPAATSSPASRAALDSLLAEITAETPRRRARAAPPRPAPATVEDPLDKTLAGVLAESLEGARPKQAPAAVQPPAETEVDDLLSRTLVGLEMSDLLTADKAKEPSPAPAQKPSPSPPATATPLAAGVTPPGTDEPKPVAGDAAETDTAPPEVADEPPPLPPDPSLPPLPEELPAAIGYGFETATASIDEIADLEAATETEPDDSAAGIPPRPEIVATTALDALELDDLELDDLELDVDHLLAGLGGPPPAPALDPEALSDEFPFFDGYEATPPEPLEEAEPVAAEAEEPVETGDPAAVFGDYTLEERIGVGAMAEVWRARRKGVEGFEKQVALKRILPHLVDNPEFVEMFIDEAKLAAQLNHNNITHIYDFGKTGHEYFIAMEFVDGRDLRTILNAGRTANDPLPGGLALFIGSRIATALDYAHRRRDLDDRELALVHRDISPQNVLINNEGEIKLCDFGIAKAVSKINTTQIGSLKGKLRYMSPEQAWGRPVDPRSDIFSLGSLLFEMLSGEPLFRGETEIAVLEAVRMCRVESRITGASGVPGPLHSVLLKALARDPGERFQTAREMQVEIDRLHHSLSGAPGQGQLARYLEDLFSEGGEERSREGTDIDVPETLKRKTVPIAPPAAPTSQPAVGTESAVVKPKAGRAPRPHDQRSRVRRIALLLAILVPLLFIGILILINRAQTDPVPEQPPDEPAIDSPSAAGASGGGETGEGGYLDLPAAAGDAVEAATTVAASLDGRPGATLLAATAAVRPAADRGGSPPVAIPAEDRVAAADVEPAAAPAAAVDDAEPTAEPLPRQIEEELRRVEQLLADTRQDTRQEESPTAAATDEPGPAAPTPARPAETALRTAGGPVAGDTPQEESPTAAATDEPGLVAPAPARPVETALQTAGGPAAETPAREPAASRLAAAPDRMPPPRAGAEPANLATSDGSERGPPPPLPEATASPAAATAAAAGEAPEAPQAVAEGELVRPGPGVIPPRLERYAKPAYTPQARRLQVEGDVVVSVLVDERGRVLEARLTQGTTPSVGLDEAALDAARRARFQPATKDGVRVKMWYDLVSRFRL